MGELRKEMEDGGKVIAEIKIMMTSRLLNQHAMERNGSRWHTNENTGKQAKRNNANKEGKRREGTPTSEGRRKRR